MKIMDLHPANLGSTPAGTRWVIAGDRKGIWKKIASVHQWKSYLSW